MNRFLAGVFLVLPLLSGCPTRTVYDSDAGAPSGGTTGAMAGKPGGAGRSGSAGGSTGVGTGGSLSTGGAAGLATGGAAGTANSGGQGGADAAGNSAGKGAAGIGGIAGSGGRGGAGSGGIPATGGMGSGGIGSGGSAGTGTGGQGTGGAATGGSGTGGKAGLGASCSFASTCQSGFCVDGVCCDSACDGTCEQCGSNGVCGMPATDAACAPVSCPQSTACKAYSSSTLTTNLCKTRGACKTAADCPFQFTSVRTPCGGTAPNQMLCDGAGSCKQPTVLCGAVASCPTNPGRCEITNSNGDPATPADSTVCTTDSGAGCSAANRYCATITCDGPSDCPTGTVCCWIWAAGQYSSCTAPQNCNNGPYSTAYFMCEPSLGNTDCPSGTTCSGSYSGASILGSNGSSYHYCK